MGWDKFSQEYAGRQKNCRGGDILLRVDILAGCVPYCNAFSWRTKSSIKIFI